MFLARYFTAGFFGSGMGTSRNAAIVGSSFSGLCQSMKWAPPGNTANGNQPKHLHGMPGTHAVAVSEGDQDRGLDRLRAGKAHASKIGAALEPFDRTIQRNACH